MPGGNVPVTAFVLWTVMIADLQGLVCVTVELQYSLVTEQTGF